MSAPSQVASLRTDAQPARLSLWTAAGTILLGSFLLFQVQPLVAKAILPALGGSSAVWTTCMLFFQALLLGAYTYAHVLSKRSSRTILIVHVALLVAAVIQMPLGLHSRIDASGDPTASVLLFLMKTVGLPYFALSSTSPLVQTLLARDRPGFVPYRLFALSNVGSFVALLSYPILVEPRFALNIQASSWTVGFLVYVVAMAGVVISIARTAPGPVTGETATVGEGSTPLAASSFVTWTMFSALASVILLATTTHLSSCIAPIPLVWVVPLALYLVSFIVTFDKPTWYRRIPMFLLSALSAVALGSNLVGAEMNPMLKIGIVASAMFVACTTAHGELVRLKPAPEHLTSFYLSISLGGALGGFFVGVIAPHIFSTMFERPLGAIMLAAGIMVLMWREKGLIRAHKGLFLALGAAIVGITASAVREANSGVVANARNFYGAVHVVDVGGEHPHRSMIHGGIVHGLQSNEPALHTTPLGYYAEGSGIARAMQTAHTRGTVHMGLVGLGVGSTLEHLREGDTARVYELDQLVVDMARKYFDVLPRHESQTTVVMGDARLSLEKEGFQGFDVLGLDAFSGDAIPMHLLSLEAFEVYARQVKPDGFLAVHISNRYLDLRPVVREAAQRGGWDARVVITNGDDKGVNGSIWVVLNRDATAMADWQGTRDLPATPKLAAWTDDHSSLWSILR